MLFVLFLFGCQSDTEQIHLSDYYGQYQYQELYYVAISNLSIPDTIEKEMNKNPHIMILQDSFQFQKNLLKQVDYREDKLNLEEKQLIFLKKYIVCDYDLDAYYRIYLSKQHVYVGVYDNTVSLRYIIKLKKIKEKRPTLNWEIQNRSFPM